MEMLARYGEEAHLFEPTSKPYRNFAGSSKLRCIQPILKDVNLVVVD
jgi:hypothetical protein